MTNIKLFFIALVLTSCSEGTIADKSVWSLHGTVFWHGSERPIAKAEVTVYDPFSNEKRFIDVTESDIMGTTHLQAIRTGRPLTLKRR